MPRITQISPSVPKIKTKLKVAAYARVSVETEMLMHSLSAQVSYYSSLIQKNPEWEYAGVYADEGITGTSTLHRDEFNRLVADCEAGKIDMVLVKSISRFVDLKGEQTEFREELWGGLVDHIRVDNEKSSTVIFRGGIEITI